MSLEKSGVWWKSGLICLAICAINSTLHASYMEGFDNVGAITNNSNPLMWSWINKSQNSGPALNDPSVGGWYQGDPSRSFFSQSGAANSYARADYSSSASFGNVFSNWFITPTLDVTAGDTFSFYTRTISNSGYPSRLQVRLSTSGSSNNVGADWTTVGDFSTLITEINPLEQPGIYPETWTQYTFSFSSTFTGRIGFRYYVVDTNNNGDYIGLDTFSTTASLANPVPEPSTYLLTLSGITIMAFRSRLKARKKSQSPDL